MTQEARVPTHRLVLPSPFRTPAFHSRVIMPMVWFAFVLVDGVQVTADRGKARKHDLPYRI